MSSDITQAEVVRFFQNTAVPAKESFAYVGAAPNRAQELAPVSLRVCGHIAGRQLPRDVWQQNAPTMRMPHSS